MTYSKQTDGTFKIELDIPRIQDFGSHYYRPVTQADIDQLVKERDALYDLMRAYHGVIKNPPPVIEIRD